MVNLHKLRLSDGMGFPRLWNRLLDELQRNTIVSVASPLMLSQDTSGQRLGIIMPQQQNVETKKFNLGAVQTDFTTGTQISVKACDANGVTSGDAFDVYVYAGGGSADLTAVTVANASATATCKLAAGKIIQYAFSGSDAYMLGDVAQVLKDWWVDADTLKVVYAVYWRVGIAVSTVSEIEGSDVLKSKRIDCTTGQVSDGGLSTGGGSYT